MKVFDFPQYGPEWWGVRRGVPTASNGKRIITPAKWEYAKAATEYAWELAADKYDPLYGFHEDYATAAMKNGTIMEPEARRWYEFEADCRRLSLATPRRREAAKKVK